LKSGGGLSGKSQNYKEVGLMAKKLAYFSKAKKDPNK
jgi:hypothetical protein